MLSILYKAWRKVSVCSNLSYNFEFLELVMPIEKDNIVSAQCQEACFAVYVQHQWKITVIIQTTHNLVWVVNYFYFILIFLNIVVCL